MTEDNGLIYMRARYYSPVLRRFINADKVHGDISNAVTLNRYAFANCNPVSNIDPLGLSAERGRGTGNGTYITAPDPSIKYYSGLELEKMQAGNFDNKDLVNGCSGIASFVLNDKFRGSLYDSLNDITRNSKCPKGVNTKRWKKQQNASLQDIDDMFGPSSKFAKFSKAVSAAGYVMDGYNIISNDIIGNIENGETDWREIGTDVAIDTAKTIGSYAAVSVGAKIGTCIGGIICPVGGQILGAIIGGVFGFAYDAWAKETAIWQDIDDALEFN